MPITVFIMLFGGALAIVGSVYDRKEAESKKEQACERPAVQELQKRVPPAEKEKP